jgi:hypothetical protein
VFFNKKRNAKDEKVENDLYKKKKECKKRRKRKDYQNLFRKEGYNRLAAIIINIENVYKFMI